jgi:RPA family protein
MSAGQATQSARAKRQPAIRVFAQEFAEASLIERGSAEFDPSFVVTKLGAKINRMLVAGLLERLERRETEQGAMYQGSIRDPTGLHMFSVGSFQPELHNDMEELLALHEQGDPVLLMTVGKSRTYQGDDGGVWTSMRLESYSIVNAERYAAWLVLAADATLRRIDAWERTRELEPTAEAFRRAEIPVDLRDGLLLARGHYGEVDPQVNLVGVIESLKRAKGDIAPVEVGETATETSTETPSDESEAEAGDAKGTIERVIRESDAGEGVDHETIVKQCEAAGYDRSAVEDGLDSLVEDGLLYEQRFGWYRHIDASS